MSSDPVPEAAAPNPDNATPSATTPTDPSPAVAKPADPKPPDAPKDDAADDSAKEAPSTIESKVDPDAGEEKLFDEKALLYRFDTKAKDWKERGAGFMKILKNPESGRCRILMRRAQTFRVCANHFILPEMTLRPNGEKALIWHAADFAEEKEIHETLCVKFKGPDVVQLFKTAFETARVQNKALGATGGEAADA
jgi:hypothetical protein